MNISLKKKDDDDKNYKKKKKKKKKPMAETRFNEGRQRQRLTSLHHNDEFMHVLLVNWLLEI